MEYEWKIPIVNETIINDIGVGTDTVQQFKAAPLHAAEKKSA